MFDKRFYILYRTPVAGVPLVTGASVADFCRRDWCTVAEGARYYAILDLAPGSSVPLSYAASHGTLPNNIYRYKSKVL